MKTDSIRNILELKYGFKDNYTQDELNKIESININRFDVDGSILNIDFNELLLLSNLKYLTINKCIIDYNIFEIIKNLNLQTLILSNCEIVDNISDIVNGLKNKNIIIDNTNFNLAWFKDLYFNSIILNNINIDNNFIINTKTLDIRKCEINNYNFISINVIPKLIISEKQYNSYFNDYKGNLIIMEENGEFILKEVNHG